MKRIDITSYNQVTEKFLKDGRWYVRLEIPIDGRRVVPQAVYNWLVGNPAFESIPIGYVIHHLDHDKFNDDISNLVLMQKHHHVAHHFKQKTIQPPVRIVDDCISVSRTKYYPDKEPAVFYREDCNRYVLGFYETINGKRKRVRLMKYKGVSFKTEEDALRAKAEIWSGKPNPIA